MTDLRPTIQPKTDQLNADALIGRSLTIKVTAVSLCPEPEQPIAINFEGDNGKPYKPGKSMRRVMVMLWGPDGSQYVGRRMTLYRDEKVQFGGEAVGGIRISHMSDIEAMALLSLTAKRGQSKPFTVRPLGPETATGAVTIDIPALLDEGRARAAAGNVALAAWWKGLSKAEQVAAKPTLDGELKMLANKVDAGPATETVVEPVQEAEPEADARPTTQAADTETAPAQSAEPEPASSASATAASGDSPAATSFQTPPAEQSPAGVASADRIDPATAAADPSYYHFIGDRMNAAGQRPFYDADGVRRGFGLKEHAIRVCRSLDGKGRACTWDGADIDAIVSEAAPEPLEAPGGGDPAMNVEPEVASDDAFGGGGDPLTNLDIYQNAIWAADDWAGLEAAVKALYATPEWKAADKAQRSGLYRMAHERVVEGGPFACSPGTNPTAFAVFVAGCEDGDQIQRTLAAGMVMPWYKNAAPATQQAATRMVLDRVEELKGP